MIKKLSQFIQEFDNYRLNEAISPIGDEEIGDIGDIAKKFREFIIKGITDEINPQGDKEIKLPNEYETVSGSFSDTNKIIEKIIKALNRNGITNQFVQKAILATAAKESGFKSTREASYIKTPPKRIREIFGSRFKDLTDDQIEELKKDETKFWDRVYGGEFGKKQLGNINPGDGAKFIGRGFNGLTGRKNYQIYSDMLKKSGINVDLIQNPEALENNPDIAAEVNALYFLRRLSDPIIKRKYGNSNPNDFKNFETALKAAVNANAGPGTDISTGFAKQSYESAKKKLASMESSFDLALEKSKKNPTA
jgi:putative chitinase